MGDTSLVGEPVEDLAPLTIRRVLLPLDGSAFAAAALHTARALSARFDAELATISVAADERRARRLRRHAAESLGSDIHDRRIHVAVGTDPAQTILDHAAEPASSLVCMSTRGRGRVGGAMIGSV